MNWATYNNNIIFNQFNILNQPGGIDGHYTIKRFNGDWYYRKKGGYGGLTWIQAVSDCWHLATKEQTALFKKWFEDRKKYVVDPIDFSWNYQVEIYKNWLEDLISLD